MFGTPGRYRTYHVQLRRLASVHQLGYYLIKHSEIRSLGLDPNSSRFILMPVSVRQCLNLAEDVRLELTQPFQVASLANLCGYHFANLPYSFVIYFLGCIGFSPINDGQSLFFLMLPQLAEPPIRRCNRKAGLVHRHSAPENKLHVVL